jgi:PKD repeat protein
VTLTVTDDRGATGTYDGTVTVTTPPPNVAPTARFTMSGSGLTADFDGSGSSDSDGSVTGYTWDFGDGATGSGVTASHTYTAAGTYTVRLTVTDDAGATGTAQQSVTLPLGYASDGFERTVTSGLGQADLGGTWTVSGGTASVSGGAGHLQIATAGGSSLATLSSVSATDLAEQVQVSLDSAPTGGGTYVALLARRTGSTYYRGVLKFLADGRVSLSITRVVSGTETGLGSLVLPGVTYSPGTSLQVRLDASGSGTTTLAAKAWLTGTPEPAGWQVTASDSTAALQASGAVGVWAYVSGSATTLPVRVNLDQFWAGPSGTAPQVG